MKNSTDNNPYSKTYINTNINTNNLTANDINNDNKLIKKPESRNVIVKSSKLYKFWQWFKKQLKI